MNEPHGWQWIEGYRNGTLSEQEFTDFQEALRSDVELRELLRRQMSIDSAIREVASTDVQLAEAWQDAGDQQAIERSATFKRAFVRTAWATPLSWTVAAVVIMITVRLLWPTNDDAESRLASEKDGEKKVDTRLTDESASDRIENLEANGEETTAQGVAIMTRLINLAWGEGGPGRRMREVSRTRGEDGEAGSSCRENAAFAARDMRLARGVFLCQLGRKLH